MSVSVLIPAYNVAPYLERTVPAVLQLEGVTEWIWVDDGSTDGTPDLLSRLVGKQPGAQLLRHDDNRGRAAARNRALEIANGDVFAFLDADACPLPGYITKHLDALSDTGAVASVGRVEPADLDEQDPYAQYLRVHPRGPSTGQGPISWRYFIAGVACVRSEVLRNVGGFNPSIAYGEDAELACRLAAQHPDGLRWAPRAKVDLFGTDGLEGVLQKAQAFGSALPSVQDVSPEAFSILGLTRLNSPVARVAFGFPGLDSVLRRLIRRVPRSWATLGVRYLLARALYRGYSNA